MQKKPPVLLIAVVLGIIAIGGTALLLSRATQPTPVAAGGGAGTAVVAPVAPTPVPEVRYIANRDIPPRTILTSDMLRRSAISGTKPPGAITSLDDVRGMITSKSIRSGDTVTKDSFIAPLDRANPARFSVPSGFRAVAVYVDPKQTAAGLVDVGDRVDVLVTQKLSIDKRPNQFIVGTKDFTAGRTVGTDLLVLAVEESLDSAVPTPTPPPAAPPPPAAGAPGAPLPADAAPPPDGAPPEVRPGNNVGPDANANAKDKPKPEGNIRVILAAPLETASRLVAANDSGVLHIVVRNPLDGDTERGPEVREYPSRTVTVAQTAPKLPSGLGNLGNLGGANKGGSRAPAFDVPDLPPVTVSQTSSESPTKFPFVPPAPPQSGGIGGTGKPDTKAPEAPQMRDVMVVRGTEKTRVLVPKR